MAACAVALTTASANAAWPERTVTIVMPYAAGGIADVVARLTAERLQAALKQTFIVENDVGAGGIVGTDQRRQGQAGRLHVCSTPIFQLTTATFDARR